MNWLSGKFSFNRIKELVDDLNDLDVKQIKHVIDKVSLNEEQANQGYQSIDKLVNELSTFDSL